MAASVCVGVGFPRPAYEVEVLLLATGSVLGIYDGVVGLVGVGGGRGWMREGGGRG